MGEAEERMTRPLLVICGMLATKDSGGFFAPFKGLATEVLTVPMTGDHAARSARDLAAIAEEVGLQATACESLEAALTAVRARGATTAPRVLITGSLYFAGEVLAANGLSPA